VSTVHRVETPFSFAAVLAAVAVICSCDDGVLGPDQNSAPILGSCNAQPNYVPQVILNRWYDFPLRFVLIESSFPVDDRDEVLERIIEGIHQWSSSTNGRIGSLVEVRDADEADLIIEADDLGTTGAARTTHATGTPFLSGGRIAFDRQTVIELSQVEDGRFISALAAHEMGHLLGIIGHPSLQDVLMSAPLQAERPTTADLNTLMHAYCGSRG
jgi:hypothetical protein